MDLFERRRELLNGEKRSLILFESNKTSLVECSKTGTEYSITKAYILIGNIDTYNYEDGFLSLYNIAKLNKFKTVHIIASCFDAVALPGTMYFRTSTDTTSLSSITAENEVRVDTATDTEYTLPITVNTKALKFFIRGNRFRGYIKKIGLKNKKED